MASRVVIEFVKLHSWREPRGFKVYHEEDYSLLYPLKQISRGIVPLWDYPWQKAGFGYGRFGYGSFGWAQGGCIDGGFGYGRFGLGEFGYFNGLVRWCSSRRFADGLHCFGVSIVGRYGSEAYPVERRIIIASYPDPPPSFAFVDLQEGILTVKWSKSSEI